VDFVRPSSVAIAPRLIGGVCARITRASRSFAAVITRGRPPTRPRAHAAATPARVGHAEAGPGVGSAGGGPPAGLN